MNQSQAQTTVVTVGAGILLLVVIDAGRQSRWPEARRVIGTGLGTLGLSALSTPAPKLAGSLALLWGASTLIISGAPALKAITSSTA